jgi:hypothetical protein
MYGGCCVCDELLVALTALLRSQRWKQPGQQLGLAAAAAGSAAEHTTSYMHSYIAVRVLLHIAAAHWAVGR